MGYKLFDYVVVGSGPVGKFTFANLQNEHPNRSGLLIDCLEKGEDLQAQTNVTSNISYQGNSIRHSLFKLKGAKIWGGAMMKWIGSFSPSNEESSDEWRAFGNRLSEETKQLIQSLGLSPTLPIETWLGSSLEFKLVHAEIFQDLSFEKFLKNDAVKNFGIARRIEPAHPGVYRIYLQDKTLKFTYLYAKKVFLCMGTYENTRVLMSSPDLFLDRSRSQLGSNLSDHLNIKLGTCSTFFSFDNVFFRIRTRRESNLRFWPRYVGKINGTGRYFFVHFSPIAITNSRLISLFLRVVEKILLGVFCPRKYEVNLFVEKFPDSLSRLHFENGILEITFQISKEEQEDLYSLYSSVRKNLKENWRQFRFSFFDLHENNDKFLLSITDTLHPSGTTTMSLSPERGVVNQNCQLWGHQNIHVFGASAFPRSSATHPTLTALAIASLSLKQLKF